MNDEIVKDCHFWINDNKRRIEHTLSIWDRIPRNKHPINYWGLGDESKDIGVCYLMLGDRAGAMEWLKKSAGYYILNVEDPLIMYGAGYNMENPYEYRRALTMAIMSGDPALIDKIIGLSMELFKKSSRKDLKSSNLLFIQMALTYCLLGRKDEAMAAIEKVPDKMSRYKSHFHGMKVAISGLIKEDKGEVVKGLNEFLMGHHLASRNVLPEYAHRLVSQDAAAFIKIARDKGIMIAPGDINKLLVRYVPWNLFQ